MEDYYLEHGKVYFFAEFDGPRNRKVYIKILRG